MGDELVVPGTEDFCRFVEAFLAGVHYEKDERSKGGHIVYRVNSLTQNISVPKGRARLSELTFNSLLKALGTERKYFREVAGTAAKLKQYVKERLRRAEEQL